MKNLINASHGPAANRAPSELLAFTLGSEEYGIDIQNVQELRGYDAVTRIANAPEFIKGVVNLRGTIVPILDMRIKFSQDSPAYDQTTVVIILNLGGRVMGIVVDSVSDVLTLRSEQIKPVPRVGPAMETKYLTGVAAIDARMLLLIDIEQLISGADFGRIEKLAA
jgi:purine-binding chemotaxis protein CheW